MNHKFTGQELDGETGLHYYNARYYHAALGRFISPDSIVPDPTDPQAFNRYSYTLNNPVNYVDPSGNFTMSIGGGSSGGSYWSSYDPFGHSYNSGPPASNYHSSAPSTTSASAAAVTPQPVTESQRAALYGEISARHNSIKLLTDTLYTDFYFFLHPNLPNDRINIAMNYAYDAVVIYLGEKMLAEGVSLVSKGLGRIASKSTAIQKYFPDNNGFLGTIERKFLMKGDKIDRFGGSDYSRFFSPEGTPAAARALPAESAQQSLRTFEVVKPFEVESGTIAPAFGQPGLGLQYKTPVQLKILLHRGIIREILP